MRHALDGQLMGRTEAAAHLLVLLQSAGLVLLAPDRASELVLLYAAHLAQAGTDQPVSHVDAADALLLEAARAGLVGAAPQHYRRLLAMLATAIGNAATLPRGAP